MIYPDLMVIYPASVSLFFNFMMDSTSYEFQLCKGDLNSNPWVLTTKTSWTESRQTWLIGNCCLGVSPTFNINGFHEWHKLGRIFFTGGTNTWNKEQCTMNLFFGYLLEGKEAGQFPIKKSIYGCLVHEQMAVPCISQVSWPKLTWAWVRMLPQGWSLSVWKSPFWDNVLFVRQFHVFCLLSGSVEIVTRWSYQMRGTSHRSSSLGHILHISRILHSPFTHTAYMDSLVTRYIIPDT